VSGRLVATDAKLALPGQTVPESCIVEGEREAVEAREESVVSDEQVAPETKGVASELLATVDLGPEIEGMEGHKLRLRMFTFDPGAVFGPMHDHKDRPGIVYILKGTITDHRNGVATDYGPGVGWPEDRNTMHWLENRATNPAVEISVDIVRHE
jgi:quercetin dioxygenase-like cupin family protein